MDEWNYGIPQEELNNRRVEGKLFNSYGEIVCPRCNSSKETTWHNYVGDAYCAICGYWVIQGVE